MLPVPASPAEMSPIDAGKLGDLTVSFCDCWTSKNSRSITRSNQQMPAFVTTKRLGPWGTTTAIRKKMNDHPSYSKKNRNRKLRFIEVRFIGQNCEPKTRFQSTEATLKNYGSFRKSKGCNLDIYAGISPQSTKNGNCWCHCNHSQSQGLKGLIWLDVLANHSEKMAVHHSLPRGRHDVCHLTPLVSWIFMGIFMRKI